MGIDSRAGPNIAALLVPYGNRYDKVFGGPYRF